MKPYLHKEIHDFYKGKLVTLRLSGFVLTLALIAFILMYYFEVTDKAFLGVGMLYLGGLLFNVFASLSSLKMKKALSVLSTILSILFYLSSLAWMIYNFILMI